jgi:FixJ family two-component response regulator
VSGPLISVVGHNETVYRALENLLRSTGFEVEGFTSAEKLLNCDRLDSISCLLLELELFGMNGLELQSHLIANNRRVPIIFITARADEVVRLRAISAGALDVLTEPFDNQAILSGIRRALSLQAKDRRNVMTEPLPSEWPLGNQQKSAIVAGQGNRTMNASSHWKQIYKEAMLELDPHEAMVRIKIAREAIYRHLLRLDGEPRESTEERQEIIDALANLNVWSAPLSQAKNES